MEVSNECILRLRRFNSREQRRGERRQNWLQRQFELDNENNINFHRYRELAPVVQDSVVSDTSLYVYIFQVLSSI
jgi:hypothetical protein